MTVDANSEIALEDYKFKFKEWLPEELLRLRLFSYIDNKMAITTPMSFNTMNTVLKLFIVENAISQAFNPSFRYSNLMLAITANSLEPIV